MAELTVARLADSADVAAVWLEYCRVDAAAFGLTPNTAQSASKWPMVEPEHWFLASLDGVACGGAGSFPTELTLPGPVVVSSRAVSDVGVLPSHRRAGVASALMRRQLDDVADRGHAVAVLHASEGSIYRRFGYGPATRWRQAVVDARRTRFRSDRPDPGGTLSTSTPAAVRDALVAVHDRVRAVRPGGLARNDAWWDVVVGDVESYLGGLPEQLAMLHLDRDGRPDGYALYRVDQDWSRGQANHTLEIWELIGETTAVEVALWRALVQHDLVATVTGPIAVDHALWDVVEDARQISIRWDQDLLWARVLDVGAALSARRWSGAESLAISVDDPFLGRGTGTQLLEVDSSGVASCTPHSGPADLHLDIAELGSVLLGGGSLRRLVRAGRVDERTPGAAARFDAIAAVDPLPWCWVRF